MKIEEPQGGTLMSSYGVPQGSILGLLSFIIYSNDISSVNLYEELSWYADDSSFFYFAPQPQNYLNKLVKWFK